MTQEISSLMDGECEAHEAERAIRSCCASREAAEKWETYHLIGDVLRGGRPHPTNTAGRVREAMQKEPAIVARPKRVYETTFGRVALAAAASVATIGVVGWIGSQGGQAGGAGPIAVKGGSAIQPVANTAPASPSVDVQDYYVAHKQLPAPQLHVKPVNRAVPAPATR